MKEKAADSEQLLTINNFFILPRLTRLKSQGRSQGTKCGAFIHWTGVHKCLLCAGAILYSRGRSGNNTKSLFL